ncbi:RsmB/NOP family class I SAM-dependent RNA methyltransferase [Candidatus Peregrinibacteria bacterium]|nr:RsmB/NOP family class I SAM-dependent RNA methyltransferase [Candidatus Peregrinibacteria bacterium]
MKNSQKISLLEKRTLIEEKIRSLYPDTYRKIIHSISQAKPTTFRINTLNGGAEVLEELTEHGIQVQKGPLPNSYVVKKGSQKEIEATSGYQNGKIYLQEFSSMLPPLILDVEKNHIVLDLAAAPGGKSTEIQAITGDESKIVCVEKNPIRFERLKYNLELQGVKNYEILLENGIGLYKNHPEYSEYFERILLDAPCSNEGGIHLSEPKSYASWDLKPSKELMRTQKGLIMSAYHTLRPGGILVYSTCTFCIEENEGIVDWLLKQTQNMELLPISLGIPNTIPGFTKFTEDIFHPSLVRTKRIIPDALFTAFFLAKFRKVMIQI